MLVELGVVEQRYQAVLEVLGGAAVTDVARRYGVARQTVHRRLRRYADQGWLAWSIRVRGRCRVLIRPRRRWRLGSRRCVGLILVGVPGRSSITWIGREWCRCRRVRRCIGLSFATGLVDPQQRRRRRSDYRRWERDRAMELWQMHPYIRA